MNLYLLSALWVGGAAIGAAVLAYLIRRFWAHEERARNNEAAGQVFTIVAGLNAVLMAFVLIALFDAAKEADDASYREADGLVAAAWASDSLPAGTGEQVRALARAYATTVINDEWPRMSGGAAVPSTGWSQLDRLRQAVARAQVDDEWQVERKTEAAHQLWLVYEARQDRLDAAGSGVDAVVWFTLLLGSVLSIGLPLLFGGPSVRAHVIIVGTLTATIALLLYATYQMQNPFGGGADVDPGAFRAALERFG
ncbi:hypothetical protein JOF41_001316 [Saccharothrix coeruleofusca]|uniref:bestrophin-like domain n=1 Tax=Saccharothrix coeruleofusca TaxID=33919 RepID=UPI001AE1018D|nr:DUF4239 domain-containing protein [Saccharothrix coeruleofusca]MBP2335138.1 hypothetical protein [Saccharothrix coeruleofusca]